jgi:hypothetical protein
MLCYAGVLSAPSSSASGVASIAKRNHHGIECVFLNSCTSAELGRALLAGLAALQRSPIVICWKTITEDSAAREFAQAPTQHRAACMSSHRRAAMRPSGRYAMRYQAMRCYAQGFYDNIGHALEHLDDGAWPEKHHAPR